MSITPRNEEIKLSKTKYIMSRTDTLGMIQYANDYFIEISGYTLNELLGKPHNIIRHPDMPKVVFKKMWERIKKGEDIYAIVKNLAKDGRYYWVTTHFHIKRHPATNEIVSYMAFRQATSPTAIDEITPVYQKLVEIENTQGIDAAEQYFDGFLDSRNQTYDDFINEISENKGAVKLFFYAMRKFFS